MIKSRTSTRENLKRKPKMIPFSPLEELLNKKFIMKAVVECLDNNDAEGVMEILTIYANALKRSKAIRQSQPKQDT